MFLFQNQEPTNFKTKKEPHHFTELEQSIY